MAAIDDRLREIEGRIGALDARIITLERNEAVGMANGQNVEKRLSGIEATLNRLVWIVITSVVGAAIAFALQGGFNVP